VAYVVKTTAKSTEEGYLISTKVS